MKRKEAIEKIKALGPKDAVWCPTEKEARQIIELMGNISGHGTEEDVDRLVNCRRHYKSNTCYSYDEDDIYIDTDTGISYCDINFYQGEGGIIYKASDFLGGEEEEKTDDELAEEINEGLGHYMDEIDNQLHIEDYDKFKKMNMQINLQSSVNQMGKTVDQEIHFVCGSVRTIENIDTSKIEQSMFTTLITDKLSRDINTENVTYVRIKSKGVNTRPGTVQPLIFHLSNDHKTTIRDIIPSTKKLGELIKYRCSNGDMILIKKSNLNAIEG